MKSEIVETDENEYKMYIAAILMNLSRMSPT